MIPKVLTRYKELIENEKAAIKEMAAKARATTTDAEMLAYVDILSLCKKRLDRLQEDYRLMQTALEELK